MKCALVGCAIAKKADCHLPLPVVLAGQSSTSSQWESSTDNAIRAKHTFVYVRNMHRTTLTTAGTCFTTKKFRYHLVYVHPFGYAMTMTAVMAGNEVIIGQMAADSNRDRLLSRIKMDKTRNFPGRKFATGTLLKMADSRHLLEHTQHERLIQRLCATINVLIGYHS
jgi:hypothetical protein